MTASPLSPLAPLEYLDLPPAEQLMLQMQAQSAYDDVKKHVPVAYAIWFVLGLCGGHRFYVRHIGIGLGMLLTGGGIIICCCGCGIIDASEFADIPRLPMGGINGALPPTVGGSPSRSI